MIENINKYNDIIDMDRPISKRKKMSIQNRAAQFAPFSALVGYEDAVKEMGRITDNKKDITDGEKEIISNKLLYIKNNLKDCGDVSITYFEKDMKKSGGSYKTVTSLIKKIDTFDESILLVSGMKIAISDVIDISCDKFNFMDM